MLSYAWSRTSKSDPHAANLNQLMVLDVYNFLISKNLTVWMDIKELNGGHIADRLREAVDACRVFVPCVTNSYLNEGKNSRVELDYAVLRRKPIVALKLKPEVDMLSDNFGFHFGRYLYHDVSSDEKFKVEMNRFFCDVLENIQEANASASFPAPSSVSSSFPSSSFPSSSPSSFPPPSFSASAPMPLSPPPASRPFSPLSEADEQRLQIPALDSSKGATTTLQNSFNNMNIEEDEEEDEEDLQVQVQEDELDKLGNDNENDAEDEFFMRSPDFSHSTNSFKNSLSRPRTQRGNFSATPDRSERYRDLLDTIDVQARRITELKQQQQADQEEILMLTQQLRRLQDYVQRLKQQMLNQATPSQSSSSTNSSSLSNSASFRATHRQQNSYWHPPSSHHQRAAPANRQLRFEKSPSGGSVQNNLLNLTSQDNN